MYQKGEILMKRTAVFLVAFAFVGLVVVGSASATPITLEEFEKTVTAPTATVDGETQSFAIRPIFDEDVNEEIEEELVIGYVVPEQTLFFAGGDEVFSDGAFFTLFDPVITAAIGVVDFGAASSFAVAVAAPLAPPIAGLATGSLSISGSFAGTGGGSADPFLTPGIAQATIEGTGVADAGPAAVFVSPSDTYGPFTVPYNVDCANFGGTCDSFDLQISFTGSGGNDAISFTAIHTLDPAPIPEPATFVLLGLGLLGTAFVVRKRRS
jgi:hypothetical protein